MVARNEHGTISDIAELNSSSSNASVNASKWVTMIERVQPLENSKCSANDETPKKDQKEDPKSDGTPKVARPRLTKSRLVTAEEIIANDGPNDWSKLTEFMRNETISEPVRSIDVDETQRKKRKRTPDI